jgi:hypothetical protein
MPSFTAEVYLKRLSDTRAHLIGVTEIEGMPREGEHVSFAHDGHMVFGRLHAIDPPDWWKQGITPRIIVHLSLPH